MIRALGCWLAVLGTTFLLGSQAAADDFTGVPEVVDGDTLMIGGQLFRLADADAPPGNALCGRPGRQWRCGMEATMALSLEVAQHWVTCTPRTIDTDGVALALCKAGPYDLAELTVLAGWAMAGAKYTLQEQIARRERKGIWRDGYIPPPGWRGVGLLR